MNKKKKFQVIEDIKEVWRNRLEKRPVLQRIFSENSRYESMQCRMQVFLTKRGVITIEMTSIKLNSSSLQVRRIIGEADALNLSSPDLAKEAKTRVIEYLIEETLQKFLGQTDESI